MALEEEQLLDLARRYTADWCSQNPASVAQHYAPTGSLTINDGRPSIGRAAIAEAFQAFMTVFPDLQVLMDRVVVRDAGADYHWTLIGTNSGPDGTGNSVRISGFEKWTLGGDGFITESQGHYDQAEYDR